MRRSDISKRLEQWIDLAQDYEFQRQLKKIDAELIDFEHSVKIALEMEENH